jgi:hypothetical protein
MTTTEQQLETQVSMMKSTIISSVGSMSTALTTYSKYSANKGTKNMGENQWFLGAIALQAYVSFLILVVLMIDLTKYRRQRLKGSKEAHNLAPFLCIILVLWDMILNIVQVVMMTRLENNLILGEGAEAETESIDLSFLSSIGLGSYDIEGLAFGVTLFMAGLSILMDTVEIASSLITGDYSEQIRAIGIEVWEGVAPLDLKGKDDDLKGLIDDDQDKALKEMKATTGAGLESIEL